MYLKYKSKIIGLILKTKNRKTNYKNKFNKKLNQL